MSRRKKHDEPDADDQPDAPDLSAPSNTTSGGEVPEPATGDEPASVEGGEKKGTAVWPPPPSDASGQRTTNVAPSKQLPPDVPASERVGAESTVTPLSRAISDVDAELARLQAENADLRQQLGITPEKAAPGKTAKARVAVPGSPWAGGEEVEYDAAAPDKDRAAIAAFQAKHGIHTFPSGPVVSHDAGE
jgi:hypothetical protein